MHVPDLIGLFVRPLEELGIPYMLTGSVASTIYGDPRFTRDIDLVLALEGRDQATFHSAFSGNDFYVPPMEVLVEEAARPQGGHFNVIHRDTALRADVYLLDREPLHRWGFERRRRLPLGDHAIWLAPLEYVILRKLQYFGASGSERHIRDVAMMVRISADSLDVPEFQRWIALLGLEAEWAEVEAFSD